MPSPVFPEQPPSLPPSSPERVDEAICRVAGQKDAWLKVSVPERIALLRQLGRGVNEVAAAWVAEGCKVKGLRPDEPLAGEEWLAGPTTTARNVRMLIEALEAGGQPRPAAVYRRADGQEVARVFPASLQDRAMFGGVSAEVFIEPGKPTTQGAIYRTPRREGRLCGVLGAGNVASIGPMDVLHKLFVEDEVCVLKMHPVNERGGPHIERAFKPLIDAGFLEVLYGGVDVGKQLTTHPGVDTLHVTGSDRTYDAIVWGADPVEAARRKAAGDPLNPRPFTAELGCVTPVLVVPGQWSDAELDYQARHVVGMVAQNASFNCNAAKVLVLARDWPQREAFLDRLRQALGRTPPRLAYYPGAKDRFESFLAQYPHAERLGEAREGVVPWTFIPGVAPRAGEHALTQEAFCGVLAQVDLPVADAESYLAAATRFANEDCWGTLSCMVFIDPRTEKRVKEAFEQTISALRYGGIAVNCWAGLIYGLVSTTWGAHPGHTPADIRSGQGVVHNSYLFDHPQKSVVRAPFVMNPKPVWFPDHSTLDQVGRRMVDMESEPGWLKLVGIAAAAFRA